MSWKWFREKAEDVFASLLAIGILALGTAVGVAIWAGFLSVAVPVIVAAFIAVLGGVLGLSAFVNRRLAPRPIEVEHLGLFWRRGERGIMPICKLHHLEVFSRQTTNDAEARVYYRPVQARSDVRELYCLEGPGHVITFDTERLDEAFMAADAMINRERVRRRY